MTHTFEKLQDFVDGYTTLGVEVEQFKEDADAVPEQTCPIINTAIRDLERAEDYIDDVYKFCDECKDRASSAKYELGDVLCSLEKLRKENELLRDLGKFWYKRCIDIANMGDKRIQEMLNIAECNASNI